jgi:hypothetical protein
MSDSDPGPVTGDAEVDDALRALDALDDLPVHDHAEIVDTVHRALQDRLNQEQE